MMAIQHQEWSGDSRTHPALKGGPVSMEPFTTEMFTEAVIRGGGFLQPLDDATKGLLWVSPRGAEELQEILDRYPGIEWVQLPWAGVDAFTSVLARLAAQAPKDRPVVTSAKGAYSEPVAEHALALLLGTMRELPSKARDARWQGERTGLSLFGRHIVLLGAGGVARAFLNVVAPFRPRVTVVRRSSGDLPGATTTVSPEHLHEVLPNADAVVVAAAATSQTAHVIGERELALMPAHAVLVNIARGSLVDADAVLKAVASGGLFGAGLDVMDPEPFPDDHPIWREKRIVITSHSADTPPMTEPLLARRISANVASYVAGAALTGVVDVEAGY
jgi:phosphoglycerate dehydrogenase-like enzyme